MLTPRPSRIVRFGVYEFDAETGDLWNGGHLIRLQEQPRQVLLLLLSHPGELVTREALRAELWPGETFVDFDAGVNVAVNKIRHALRDSAASPRFIETLPRRGYRFIAPVAPVPAHRDAANPAAGNGRAVHAGSADQSARHRTPIWPPNARSLGLLLGSVAAVAGISVGVYTWRANGSHRFPAPDRLTNHQGLEMAPAPSTDARSNAVTVAIFENRTADGSLDPLGQQVSERIIRLVAGTRGVDVRPQPIRLAAGASGESAVPAPGESLVVTGTYFVHQGGLEFQARILEARNGRLLHAPAPVAGRQTQPADALDLVAQKVAGAVAIHFDEFFGGLDVVSHPPTLDAYREYRAGLETFASDYPRALAHLERALEKDPGFLLPLVVMYFARFNLGESDQVESLLARMEEPWDRLTAAERLWVEFLRAYWEGRRAQALRVLEDVDRLIPRSLVVNYNLLLQSLRMNRLRAAVDTYNRSDFSERTLRHSIGTFRHHQFQEALHLLGDYDRELQHADLAQRDAPGVLRFLEAEARALVALRRLDDVQHVIDRSLSITAAAGTAYTPGAVMEDTARELRAHGYREDSLKLAARAVEWYGTRPPDEAASRGHRAGLAHALYLAERWKEAGALFSALANENPGGVDYMGYRGCIAARMNDMAGVQAISAELARVRDRQLVAPATYARARIAALLGDRKRAVDLLRDALAEGYPFGVDLHGDPDLEPLRGYRPYLELVRPLN